MARMRFLASIIGACIVALTSTANVSFAASTSPDDTARFLAGMPPSALSPIAKYTGDSFWKQHAKSFDDSWSGLEKRQLSKIRSFVSKNLTNPQPVLFCFFSGPDFLYADAFFPAADTYIMAGLEPPGPVPDLGKFSHAELPGALRELRGSLNSVLSYSFFRTKSMRVDFSHGRLTGTLPVLMTFRHAPPGGREDCQRDRQGRQDHLLRQHRQETHAVLLQHRPFERWHRSQRLHEVL